jgi:hypothetical protein
VKQIIVVLVMLAASLFMVSSTAAPAQAVPGCTSQVQLRGSNWFEDITYYGPRSAIGGGFFDIRATATAAYWFCPNGVRPNEIKVKWIEFCWHHKDPNHGSLNFDGMRFNAKIYDSVWTVNPGEKHVNDTGAVVNCEKQNIPEDNEIWMEVRDRPRWSVDSWVKLQLSPDKGRAFTDGGDEVRDFAPWYDVTLGDFHWKTRHDSRLTSR